MKRKLFAAFPILAVTLCACANYRADSLNNLQTAAIYSTAPKAEGVHVIARAFDAADCKRYLDRNVLAKGYQPIQLCIRNDTDESYVFSLDRISLSHTRPEVVAETVHTSTVGRAVGYGAAALIIWPFAIPAILDGVWSAQANEALDIDFSSKSARDQVIYPHTCMNKLIFVPASSYQPQFRMELMEEDTQRLVPLDVTVS